MNQPATIRIEAATIDDLAELAQLFDAYRVFYKAASDPVRVDAFLHGLITHHRTHIFLARQTAGAPALGFVHLMPSLNTIAMRPIWLLEDLYVVPSARKQGVATALMRHAESFARQTGAERLTLATAHDNHDAQALYRNLGYEHEDHFRYYHRMLD
jgi:GNAT superfamily N-acetyltransferase